MLNFFATQDRPAGQTNTTHYIDIGIKKQMPSFEPDTTMVGNSIHSFSIQYKNSNEYPNSGLLLSYFGIRYQNRHAYQSMWSTYIDIPMFIINIIGKVQKHHFLETWSKEES